MSKTVNPPTPHSDPNRNNDELPLAGFKGTPEEIERQWFEQVYKGRGDRMPQLTWRAVIMGSLLGGVLSLTNLYIGLKAGWGFGVAITACILSYAIWTTFQKISGSKLVSIIGWAAVAAVSGAALSFIIWQAIHFPPGDSLVSMLLVCACAAFCCCLLAFAAWHGVQLLIGRKVSSMTILENNCMQSTASAAGYSTGGTLVSAFAAFILLNGQPLPLALTLGWVFFLAILGVTMAVPMKRQMINVEQLRFPSGIAAAETLRALHSHGEKGMRAAKALGIAGILAALDKFWAEGLVLVSKHWEKFTSTALLADAQKWLLGADGFKLWNGRTVTFAWDFIFVAAGAITGLRVCVTMFISGTLCWAVFVPVLQQQGVITGSGFRDLVQWTLWFGTACMVSSGLLSFVLQWRSALRAFRSLGKMFSRGGATDEVEAIETPMAWFAIGQGVSLIALAWLAHESFAMPYWQSVLAVLLSFALAVVACRVTGETDTTPIGAMGKVTQLTFGAINPGNVNVNLMAANITAGAATSAADLLTDLKSGYLLGANPRKQFLAQFAGIFIGTLATVFTFRALVPDASALGTDQFPAPAAQTWAAVAKALSKGLAALEPVKVWSIFLGGALGIVLSVLPAIFPKRQKFLPSAAAFGLAWVFHWYYSLLFLMGAVIAWWFEKNRPKLAEEFTFPVASGIIAGGSLMGVALVFWENGAEMIKKLFGGG